VLGRFPGLKSFLTEGHAQKYAKLETEKGRTPPAIRFIGEDGAQVESVEVLTTHTVEEIKSILSSRNIHPSDEVQQPAPDTSCGGHK